jgi:cytochrome c-type biogenesis protein CcmF
MEYAGEHLWAGDTGHVFVICSFVFALLSSIAYFFAAKENEQHASWLKIARIAFRLHGLAVIGIVVTLFIMLMNHYFEYEYVWHHSNKEMPMRYIFSCFWEGQEGSFLLWTFWHVVIGLILQRTAKKWEAPVMATVSLVQVFLASMLLGIVVLDLYIGRNPFTILLREHPDYANIPLFQSPDYLDKLDGRGLNPLLQNYWMTIHPPTLFLGFALTVVPFAYAIAGLWKKRYNDWQKPALTWTFAGVMVLGTGILMGGAWAYEALSFGGFWAWDPVENASLVPWLTLVGAAHVMLINKNNGQSLLTTFFLCIISFILILYSTFLTRSGVLGDSSVHAFTDLGMSGQLLIYLLFFLFLGILLIITDRNFRIWYSLFTLMIFIFACFLGHRSWFIIFWIVMSIIITVIAYIKFFPKELAEESIWSREFWMFIGAVILSIAAFHLIFNTSLPVINKVFGTKMAAGKDLIKTYNDWQGAAAVVITILIAIGQYFKYKDTDMKQFRRRMTVSLVIALILTTLMSFILNYRNALYVALLFSSIFAAVSNMDYFVRVVKGKVSKAGASLAHVGFALILLGALISTSKKEIISQNTSGKDIQALGDKMSNRENILLTQGDTLPMGQYLVTYKGKRFEGINIYFDVDYFTRTDAGTLEKAFSLSPLVQTNPRMGNVAEPDTRHFLTYDVYTHVTYADLEKLKEKTTDGDEYTAAKNFKMHKGDTIFSSNAIIILDSLSTWIEDREKLGIGDSDLAVTAHLRVLDIKARYEATPVYRIRENSVQPIAATVPEMGLQFMFWKLNPETGEVEISLQEKKSNVRDFIVMQAMIFPYINILWIGCIIMIFGTVIAIIERVKKNRRSDKTA